MTHVTTAMQIKSEWKNAQTLLYPDILYMYKLQQEQNKHKNKKIRMKFT